MSYLPVVGFAYDSYDAFKGGHWIKGSLFAIGAVVDLVTLGEEGALFHIGEELTEHAGEELVVRAEEEVLENAEENFVKNVGENVEKDVVEDVAKNQGRSGRDEALDAIANDPKQPSHIRGWFKNEQRRIANNGGKGKMRMPGNTRRSVGGRQRGYELAHPKGMPAKAGNSYKGSRM